jgi:hypothetical protein
MPMIDEVTYLPPVYVFAPAGTRPLFWSELVAQQIAQEGPQFVNPLPPPLVIAGAKQPWSVVSNIRLLSQNESAALVSVQETLATHSLLPAWQDKIVMTSVREYQKVLWYGDWISMKLKLGSVRVNNLLSDIQRRLMPPEVRTVENALRREQYKAVVPMAVSRGTTVMEAGEVLGYGMAGSCFYDPGTGIWWQRPR